MRGNVLHYEDIDTKPTRKFETRVRVAVPESLSMQVINLYHLSHCSGHPSGDELYTRINSKFLIKNLSEKIKNISCHTCDRTKRVNGPRAPLKLFPVVRQKPMSEIHMDILGPLPMTNDKNKYILAYVDRFTRFTILDAIPDRCASTVAKSFFRKVICPFTTPEVLISDNAKEFVCDLLFNLCKLFNIRKTCITSYSPFANGLVEAANKRTLTVLRKIVQDDKWDEALPFVEIALNTSYQKSIGDTPHYLVFLADKILPHDLRTENNSEKIYPPLVDLVEKQRKIYNVVKENLEAEARKFTEIHNSHSKSPKIKPGNRVYIKKRCLKEGEHKKLAPLYDGPFRVMNMNDKFRYTLKHLNTGKTMVVHANHMKLVNEPAVVREEVSPQKNEGVVMPNKKSYELKLMQYAPTDVAPARHGYNLRRRANNAR